MPAGVVAAALRTMSSGEAFNGQPGVGILDAASSLARVRGLLMSSSLAILQPAEGSITPYRHCVLGTAVPSCPMIFLDPQLELLPFA
jgi:hypothetical protein